MARYALPPTDDGWPCIFEGENRTRPAESDYDEDPGPVYEADLERWPTPDSVNINWENDYHLSNAVGNNAHGFHMAYLSCIR